MSRYAYLDKHGRLVGPVSMRPRFRGVQNWPNLTDEQRREKRWYPVTETNKDFDPRIQNRSGPVLTLEDGIVTATYTVTDKSIESLIEDKCRQVDARRDQELAAGVEYEFPDGTLAIIQTRDSRDERNILTCHSMATTLLLAGQTETVMQFRTEDDGLHDLTPNQMIAMTTAVGVAGQGIYAISWQVKDAIRGMVDPVAVVDAAVWAEDVEEVVVPEEV
jgi:hypothetical protein